MQATQGDDRFPGRARTLGTTQAASVPNSDSSLQTRLLDDVDDLDQQANPATFGGGQHTLDGR